MGDLPQTAASLCDMPPVANRRIVVSGCRSVTLRFRRTSGCPIAILWFVASPGSPGWCYGTKMKTVQLAIRDAACAQTICNVLRREGRHTVLVVDQPDLALDGVIVLDCEHLEHIGMAEEPGRFVLVTRKDPDKLAWIWNAGIRHVVFEDDSANTVQLAVSAAELRQTLPSGTGSACTRGTASDRSRRFVQFRRDDGLPILNEGGTGRCRACHHCFPANAPEEL
jgi:hypothetical protein